ncbi:hypothetical protein BH20VER3_BH20VER3_14970 [soil metagenome]
MNFIQKFLLPLAALVLSTTLVQAQSSSRIVNISTRAYCQTGDAVVVTEFILQGSGSETCLMRGIGPSLGSEGIAGALQDPITRLLNSRGKRLDINDNWVDSPDKDQIIATGLAPKDDRESAMIDSFRPGTYTFVLQGVRRGEGVGLAEVYDLTDGDLQLTAIGCRAFVQTGDHVLISGFIISGNESLPILVRALGPSLTDVGLSNALPNPFLELHNANGTLIATNDNWRDTQQAEIEQTGLAPSHDLDSALLATLAPGAYTAVVKGINDTTGLAFVQYYSLDFPPRELNPAPPLGRR